MAEPVTQSKAIRSEWIKLRSVVHRPVTLRVVRRHPLTAPPLQERPVHSDNLAPKPGVVGRTRRLSAMRSQSGCTYQTRGAYSCGLEDHTGSGPANHYVLNRPVAWIAISWSSDPTGGRPPARDVARPRLLSAGMNAGRGLSPRTDDRPESNDRDTLTRTRRAARGNSEWSCSAS
jgi:hypothetical protein